MTFLLLRSNTARVGKAAEKGILFGFLVSAEFPSLAVSISGFQQPKLQPNLRLNRTKSGWLA